MIATSWTAEVTPGLALLGSMRTTSVRIGVGWMDDETLDVLNERKRYVEYSKVPLVVIINSDNTEPWITFEFA